MANNTGIKYGGRQKGTANKATTRLREAFTGLLEGNIGRLQELLDKVAEKNPQKALELLLKLSEFVLPKLRDRCELDLHNETKQKSILEKMVVIHPHSMWKWLHSRIHYYRECS